MDPSVPVAASALRCRDACARRVRAAPRSRQSPRWSCDADSIAQVAPGDRRRHRSDHRHRDAPRGARVRRAGVGRHDRRRDDPQRTAAGEPVRDAVARFRACSRPIARTTRRTCRSARADSARAPRSACAACGSTRTASRSRCPTGRGRPAASACCPRERIEVLRGPFSALYGNASGGVISVFTEDPSDCAAAVVDRRRRQLRNRNARRQARRTAQAASARSSRRASSSPTAIASTRAARRDLTNAKLVLNATPADARSR